MTSVFQMIQQSGIVGWLIVLVGIGALGLIAERAYSLYVQYSFNHDEFWKKIHQLVLARKPDQALALCNQFSNKPLAHAFKTILEKSDREDDAIFQAHDIAMSEVVPSITKRLHYLSMLANVATLMGLLGTIHGLIISFQAVAQADPALKQTLLANGISVSMYTTAFGLAVAIPAMIFYSFLVSRQNYLVDQMTEKCGKLTELLTGSNLIQSFNRSDVFPDNLKESDFKTKVPPTDARAS